MRTTYLIKQHERAIALLDGIERANERAASFRKSAKTSYHWSRRKEGERLNKRSEGMKAVAARLQERYSQVLDNITSKAEA